MRRMGGLINFLPFTYICIFFASLAITGFPFLTGFYSKDLLLELINTRYVIDSDFIYFLSISAAFFTALYSIRMIIYVFGTKNVNLYKTYLLNLKENGFYMSIVMFLLTILTIFIGYIFSDIVSGFGTYIWGPSIFVKIDHFNYIEPEFLNPIIKNLPFLLTLVSLFTFFFFEFIYRKCLKIEKINYVSYKLLSYLYRFFYPAGFFNFIYNNFFLIIYNFSYNYSTKIIDKGFLEIFGPYGIYNFFFLLSNKMKKLTPFVIFQNIFLIFSYIFLILLIINFSTNFPIIFIFFTLLIFYFEWINVK